MAGSVLLIIADDPAQRALFNRHLGATAHHLVFATNGEDGFDRFAEVKPDLVIAHVNAPRIDGAVLCQLVRKQPRGEQVPFVLLGGEAGRSRAAQERVGEAGADAFLPFPFDRRTLIERITPLLTFGRSEPSILPHEPPGGAERPKSGPVQVAAVTPPEGGEKHAEAGLDSVRAFSEVVEAIEEDEVETRSTTSPVAEELGGSQAAAGPRDVLEEPVAPAGKSGPPSGADSMDTVVSFQNPFLEGAGSSPRPVIALEPEPRIATADRATQIEVLDRAPQAQAGDGRVKAPEVVAPALPSVRDGAPRSGTAAALDEGRREPSLDGRRDSLAEARRDSLAEVRRDSLAEVRRDSLAEVRRDGLAEARRDSLAEARRDSLAEARPGAGIAKVEDVDGEAGTALAPAPAPELLRARSVPSAPMRGGTAAELRHQVADSKREAAPQPSLSEPPILDRVPRDRLEEPPISGIAPPVPDHSESSEKARLIQEPARDTTPSRERARSPLRETAPAAVRRGLDESQLGKRLAKRVRAMYDLLDEVDHYQLLGVDTDAAPDVVTRAYFELSLEFHPDRFFLLRSGDLKEKIYAIFRRIGEAYGVLGDDRRRRAYDEQLSRSAPGEPARSASEEQPDHGASGDHAAVSSTNLRATTGPGIPEIPTSHPKVKRSIELARLALQDEDLDAARLHLHLALTYEESNTKLEAAVRHLAELARPTLVAS